ncbi:MAG: response regulator transcription factor [Tenericutes bacterium]|nr:response regulator transcription factor [Mycoplasmatota bacterium]
MINILVIEDEENIRTIIKKVLTREGYKVLEAGSAEEGLEIIDKKPIDLIVLDVTLPNMDGYEFTKELRSSHMEIPILMATARQLPMDKHKGFIVGTDDYMTKPLDMDEFILRIKALLRRSKIVSERKIQIGKVTLDYDSLTVTRENEKTTLPQKEFYLLYKLLSYPDKIFTRLELMDEIWGYETDSEDTTINVHINRLRKKFESYPEFEIKAIRGLGYKAVKKIEE